MRDRELIAVEGNRRAPELPVRPDQLDLVIPALNLPFDALLDVYRNTPALLQPFARVCSVSGRTLSGLIPKVELEAFAQGPSTSKVGGSYRTYHRCRRAANQNQHHTAGGADLQERMSGG